jgi:hypothetical protein
VPGTNIQLLLSNSVNSPSSSSGRHHSVSFLQTRIPVPVTNFACLPSDGARSGLGPGAEGVHSLRRMQEEGEQSAPKRSRYVFFNLPSKSLIERSISKHGVLPASKGVPEFFGHVRGNCTASTTLVS